MKTYQVHVDIDASHERVWQMLTQEMPKDPTPYGIVRLEGILAPKAKIKLWSEVAPNRAFSLVVERMEAPGHMVWAGGMPLGLFTGTRSFQIEATATGCSFSMREVFSGLLANMITRSMPDLTPSFSKFADTLKRKAETQ